MRVRARIKQWFYPNAVTRQKQPLVLFVPNSKGEKAVEALHAVFFPLQVCFEHDLRIAV